MPSCLPVTEAEERKPESAYSLSKLVGETIAEQYTRWDPATKIISLRFSNVMLPQEYATFEGWQKDPKARYWNCWGYIGMSLPRASPAPVSCLVLLGSAITRKKKK